MEFANSAIGLLWSIDRWQPLRSDPWRAQLRWVRKNKEPFRNASEGDALSGQAIG
jgi:hypothetical protein